MNKYIKLGINFAAMALVITAAIVGTNVALFFEGEIGSVLNKPITSSEDISVASALGQEMSKRIMEEGAVLLRNEKNNENDEKPVLPLDRDTNDKVNVFGWRSVDWIYGSEGPNASGGVAPETGDGEEAFKNNIDIYDALDDYGIQYNESLMKMYWEYKTPTRMTSRNLKEAHISTVTKLIEPSISDKNYYTPDLLEYTENFSDTAIVMISRMAGEGMNCSKSSQVKNGPKGESTDGTRHYLELSTEEEELLKYCGKTFKNVIVMMNMANQFECNFLETIEGIDACMYIGFTGTRAASVLPKLLYGEVSPSGHLADTFAYDLINTNPSGYWGDGSFSNSSGGYTPYIENGYIGYKWYETADVEGIWTDYQDKVSGRKGYDGVVQFPFGFGKSYTSFDWKVDDIKIGENSVDADVEIDNTTKIEFTVTVTNTGTYAGKDVVAAYVTAPYTKGGIEKSYVSLLNFTKTNTIAPGASEQVKLTVDAYDMASYDCYDKNNNGFKGWELEGGEYSVKLMTDSHNIKKVAYYNATVDAIFAFNVNNAETEDHGYRITHDPITNQPVGNLFTGEDAVDAAPIDGGSKNGTKTPLEFFTREKFISPNDFATEAKKVNGILRAPEVVNYDDDSQARLDAWDNATTDIFGEKVDTSAVTWGANNGKKLYEGGKITELGKKLGTNYDDPEWKAVLDQISMQEATGVINRYYGTKAISSVGKPALTDLDGPAQIKGFNTAPRGTGYPTMVVIAQTWNPKLAYEFGKSYGDDMKSVGVYGLWGWAIDNHRSPFFGRNHESPSEDGQLAGIIISNAVKGLNTKGRYCFLKHFALYSYGGGYNIYLTEQSLRENQLRGFRKAFVEGQALGCMTTYQGFGVEHSETTEGLLVGVLRKEWQFKGAITTDYIGNNGFCETILRCGGDLGMGVGLKEYNTGNTTNRFQHALKDAMKHVLWTWLRADYNETEYLKNPDVNDVFISSSSIQSWCWWKPLLYSIDVAVGVSVALWATYVLLDTFMKKDSKEEVTNETN